MLITGWATTYPGSIAGGSEILHGKFKGSLVYTGWLGHWPSTDKPWMPSLVLWWSVKWCKCSIIQWHRMFTEVDVIKAWVQSWLKAVCQVVVISRGNRRFWSQHVCISCARLGKLTCLAVIPSWCSSWFCIIRFERSVYLLCQCLKESATQKSE